ncbi:MAG TPA: Trk system potassium transporter TrkA [Opitutales bacterium]|nr:Trk system potassium transporter TrkA [Opitutales bacterium]
MKIIIVGAGEVGSNLSTVLSASGHDVTLIEKSEGHCERLEEEQNARIVTGNGSSARQLVEVGVGKCDAFLAMTSDDRTNIISCSLAKGLGAKNTIARIHDETYSDTSILNYQLHFGIDLLVNPEAICAVELAKEIRSAGRVEVEHFARGQIEVQRQRVAHGSRLIGKKLKDIKLDSQVRVGYIHRGEATEIANADSVLQEDDIVTLFGHPEVLFSLREKFDPKQKIELSRVVLFGGSEAAINLIHLLKNPRFKIRVIEKDRKHCQRLAERFPHITVINGDATSIRLMEEEQINHADYFVACTKDDEENILTCIQASKLGAKHVQLLINKGDYDDLLEMLQTRLDIEVAVSPRRATADFMLRNLSNEAVAKLAEMPDGSQVLEVRISHASPVIGRKIKDIRLPGGCLLVALLHKFKAKVPAADDTILAGDRVVVIVSGEKEKEVRQALV